MIAYILLRRYEGVKMDVKIITVKELMKNNQILCMAPMRYFDKCCKCDVFNNTLKHNDGDIVRTIDILRCDPHINDYDIFLIKKHKMIKKELEDIEMILIN